MMQTLAVNWSNLGMGLFIVWFLVVCVLLMLAVLIQKPQGGGLAGAFGSGAGSGQTAFGAKTGDALTWATIIIFVLWLLTAVFLNLAFQPANRFEPAQIVSPEGAAAPATTGETGTPATEGDATPIAPEPMPLPPADTQGDDAAPTDAPAEPEPTEPPAAAEPPAQPASEPPSEPAPEPQTAPGG